jgi:hypothetical protein
MKILILWGDLPSPTTGSSIPIFNLLPYLKQKHDLTLLTFQIESDEPVYLDYLKQYCEVIGPLPKKLSSEFKRNVKSFINTLNPRNLFSRNPVFFNLMYSLEMREMLDKVLSRPEVLTCYTATCPWQCMLKMNQYQKSCIPLTVQQRLLITGGAEKILVFPSCYTGFDISTHIIMRERSIGNLMLVLL